MNEHMRIGSKSYMVAVQCLALYYDLRSDELTEAEVLRRADTIFRILRNEHVRILTEN